MCKAEVGRSHLYVIPLEILNILTLYRKMSTIIITLSGLLKEWGDENNEGKRMLVTSMFSFFPQCFLSNESQRH